MKILSRSECEHWLNARLRSEEAHHSPIDYDHGLSYRLPSDTGKKTALARVISEVADADPAGLLWITAWSIFPSSENVSLFDAYRRSLGEKRNLNDAPGHLFSASDKAHLECLLDLCLYFYWDADLFSGSGTLWIKISHDEYMDVNTKGNLRFDDIQRGLEPLNLAVIKARPRTS